MKAGNISFRPLLEADFPLMHKWLNTPHVSEWWNLDGSHHPTLNEVEKHYRPRISGQEPVDCYITLVAEKPIGMIQSCKLDDFPDEKIKLGLEGKCASIDLFIGEEDYVHRGMGSVIIRHFLKETVFRIYDIDYCIIDPDPKNAIAIRAYQKAGFKYIKTTRNTKDNIDAYLMRINRDEIK